MSREGKTSEIEKRLNRSLKRLDEYFNTHEDHVKSYVDYFSKLSGILSDLNEIYKRADATVSKEDLEFLSRILTSICKKLSDLATVSCEIIVDQKDFTILFVRAIVHSREGLDTLEREMQRKKEIELKVPENIQKELEEWMQWRERAKKAQSQYVR